MQRPHVTSLATKHGEAEKTKSGVVQAAQLVTLALEMVDDQGVLVPGIPALELYILDMLPA